MNVLQSRFTAIGKKKTNKPVVTTGEKVGGMKKQGYGTNRYKLQCIKQISSMIQFIAQKNYSYYLVMTYSGI